jgi:hypothetical protein
MMFMEHDDLIKRINNETNTPPVMEAYDEQGNEWRDTDRQSGHVRYEIKVPLSRLGDIVSKLFGGKKS